MSGNKANKNSTNPLKKFRLLVIGSSKMKKLIKLKNKATKVFNNIKLTNEYLYFLIII